MNRRIGDRSSCVVVHLVWSDRRTLYEILAVSGRVHRILINVGNEVTFLVKRDEQVSE